MNREISVAEGWYFGILILCLLVIVILSIKLTDCRQQALYPNPPDNVKLSEMDKNPVDCFYVMGQRQYNSVGLKKYVSVDLEGRRVGMLIYYDWGRNCSHSFYDWGCS